MSVHDIAMGSTPDGGARRDPWRSAAITWYRPSIRREIWRLWRYACLWLLIGAFVLGALRVMDVDFGSAYLPLYLVGLAFVTAAPWQIFVGLQRTVKVERVLSLHEEGVRWQDGATVVSLPWSDLDHIEIVAGDVVLGDDRVRVIVPGELEGIGAPALVTLLLDMRKKALLGLPVRLAHIPDRT